MYYDVGLQGSGFFHSFVLFVKHEQSTSSMDKTKFYMLRFWVMSRCKAFVWYNKNVIYSTGMPDMYIQKRIFYNKLKTGKHSYGKQQNHFKGMLKAAMKYFGRDSNEWEKMAHNQSHGKTSTLYSQRSIHTKNVIL